jgi:hypothetical protein
MREYPLFSLCGLNCGLCPRYHTKGSSKCPGCGGEAFYEKHPPCGVISCAERHSGIEYCYQCDEYPCKKYYDGEKIRDSFITKRRQFTDFEKAEKIGLDAYQAELNEKVEILGRLLNRFDDGRRKNFFCLAVNLLELMDIKDVMARLEEIITSDFILKEKAALAVRLFQEIAYIREIPLELRK